jgi:hypothetical protein
MKTTETRETASAKTVLISALTVVFVLYVVPFCSLPVRSVSGAVLFTIVFGFYRDSFRSRSRSLIPAYCLVAFVWLCAAVTIAFSFLGAH